MLSSISDMNKRLSKIDLFRYFYSKKLEPYHIFHGITDAKLAAAAKIAEYISHSYKNPINSFCILDVGCGEGELIISLVRELKRFAPQTYIDLHAMDPSSEMLTGFRNKLKKKSLPEIANVNLHQIGLNKRHRLKEICKSSKFDLVLASFVLFWIDDWSDAIDQMLKVLTPTGKICIILLAKRKGRIGATLRSKLFSIAHKHTGYNLECAEDVEEILRQKGLKWESSLVSFHVEIPAHEKENIRTSNGESISALEFMTRFPWNKLSSGQKKEMIETASAYKSQNPICYQKLLWISKGKASE